MRDGGRIAAAIAVLNDIESRHKPARMALKNWGESARYAGAKDRAFVSGLVLDVLRRGRSLAWRMDDEGNRARVLAALRFGWDWPLDRIAEGVGDEHGPGALGESEARHLAEPTDLAAAPDPVRGDYPDWLDPYMARVFGADRAAEGVELAARAPIDIRVNTLKTDVARALKALEPFNARTTDLSETALRIDPPAAADRAAPVEAAPEFEKGWFEIQDLGSQAAAAAAGDIRGRQVLDFCAGGGGKTLALAAAMGNSGQLYAYDSDARRLTDTVRRAQRAGVRNLQVRSPIHAGALAGLESRMDLVFVDAPCTGSGTWRRHPDAKWRLSPEQLIRRMSEQDRVLRDAAPYVKPGGRLIFVTCSLFAEENEDRVAAFLAQATAFRASRAPTRLSPRTHETDGFFIAILERGG
jgi:16S rRNA (cytosine967-C5)-methyltransferase